MKGLATLMIVYIIIHIAKTVHPLDNNYFTWSCTIYLCSYVCTSVAMYLAKWQVKCTTS